MMKTKELLPVNIERYLSIYPESLHLDNLMILTNVNEIRLPEDTRQMQCVLLGLCLSGSASYTMGTIDHKVSTNDVIIVGEGQTLGDISTSPDFSGMAMLVSHEFLDGVIADVRNISNLFVFAMEHPVFHLDSNEAMMISDYVSLLRLKLQDQTHHYRRQVVGTMIASIIYEVANAAYRTQGISRQRNTRSEAVFTHFIQLVEQNYHHTRRVKWYSDQLGMTPKSLLDMVKRTSQRTPNEWLDIYTIMEMRHLLRHTTMSMKEISESLNFATQASMGKFFKDKVGMAPTAYRTK